MKRIAALLDRLDAEVWADTDSGSWRAGAQYVIDEVRNAGVTLAPTPPNALDVERLAKAMRKVHEECRDRPYDLIDVPEDVAREYAALAQPEEADRADG